MLCWYCEKIVLHLPQYLPAPPAFDMGSETPRCRRHWRHLCDLCLQNHHFKGMAFCPQAKVPFCHHCALVVSVVASSFWGNDYYWNCRCPFCAGWHPTLDFAEYQGAPEPLPSHLSKETHLERRFSPGFTPVSQVSDATVEELWDRNAETWSRLCGPQGDQVRRFVSDPVLFRLLGPVDGEVVLDAGSGEGYLSRLLAGKGARVWAVENSRALHERALAEERRQPLGIHVLHGSIGRMSAIPSAAMDAVVCNNVFMYCADVSLALAEFARVLKSSGRVVIVMTHPCFWGPGTDWVRTPPDTPRPEEWRARRVERYFDRTPHQFVTQGYESPLVFFPRTVGDYVSMFTAARFRVTDLVEPTLEEGAPPPLSPGLAGQLTSLPMSIVFRLVPIKSAG